PYTGVQPFALPISTAVEAAAPEPAAAPAGGGIVGLEHQTCRKHRGSNGQNAFHGEVSCTPTPESLNQIRDPAFGSSRTARLASDRMTPPQARIQRLRPLGESKPRSRSRASAAALASAASP